MNLTSKGRRQYVGVSTKMYLGYQASLDWLAGVRNQVLARPALAGKVEVFVAPSFPVLESARRILDGSGVLLSAQNSSAEGGALTGEVSPTILAELGVELVEVGHADRRRLFGEDDAVVALKTAAVATAGMTPLLCIGESGQGTSAGAVEFCFQQVRSALGGTLTPAAVILAYEPVWAIGAGKPAPPEYVNDVIGGLRGRLAEHFGGSSPAIVYGGSAGPGLLPLLESVDGLFLGRFAHDPANLGMVLDEALGRASQ